MTTQDYLTPELRAEARATTAATTTVYAPNARIPKEPLSNSTEEPSNFLSLRLHLTSQGNNLPQLKNQHQVTLPDLTLHTLQNVLQLNYIHNNSHQFLIPPKQNTLPVEITQACLLYFHLIRNHKNLPNLFFRHQISTLPVDIPLDYHLWSHLTYQWWSLPQLHHQHQVTLPVDIHTHSNQNKHYSNSLTLSTQHNITYI